jgi:acetoin utilization deacetylase AcuC-like enzyme
MYVSTHESPLYPGTGRLTETGGAGAGGTTLNLPFPAGTAGDTLRRAFDSVVVPCIERFAPDWLIISAGFDAHRNDPLAGMSLTSADYADLALRLQQLVGQRRVLVVLEGGYDMEALTFSTGATLSALLGESYRPEPASTGEIGMPTVTAARQLLEL